MNSVWRVDFKRLSGSAWSVHVLAIDVENAIACARAYLKDDNHACLEQIQDIELQGVAHITKVDWPLPT
jgi:hypothetical protein